MARRDTPETPQQFPTQDSGFYDGSTNINSFLQLKSVTYNIPFYFLPYSFKMTETLLPQWKEETVIGRMDPIATFKRMGRTLTLSFQARANKFNKETTIIGNTNQTYGTPQLTAIELLHTIDHVKKCLYPRYEGAQIMTSPPLWRIKYQNLINAGQNTKTNGTLCYITQFAANPQTDVNKLYYADDGRIYPKVFDVNMTMILLNEDLVRTQQSGILNERYFYDYVTDYHKD
jgi:hypothetical protein